METFHGGVGFFWKGFFLGVPGRDFAGGFLPGQVTGLPRFVLLLLDCLTLPDPSVIKISSRSRMVPRYAGRLFRSSSMAEHPAVNRRVVSSSLTCGARLDEGRRS